MSDETKVFRAMNAEQLEKWINDRMVCDTHYTDDCDCGYSNMMVYVDDILALFAAKEAEIDRLTDLCGRQRKLEAQLQGEINELEPAVLERDALRQEVEALRGFLADIASVAGRDVPDAIDNDGQPYQSQSLSNAIDRVALPTTEPRQ